jgi:hypothetical protein
MQTLVPDLDEAPLQTDAFNFKVPLPEDFDLPDGTPPGPPAGLDEKLGWEEPEYLPCECSVKRERAVCKCAHCGNELPKRKPKPTPEEQITFAKGIRWTLQQLIAIHNPEPRADAPFVMAKMWAPDLLHSLSYDRIIETGVTHADKRQRLNTISGIIKKNLTNDEGGHLEINRPMHSGMKSAEARAKLRGPKSYRTGRKPKSKQPEPSLEPVAAESLNDDYSQVTNE